MIALLEAIVLGVIQGLTEFMPISSSAHLIIVPWLFGWGDIGSNSLAFDVALHLGTLTAVLWFFYADWLRLFRAMIASLRERAIGADKTHDNPLAIPRDFERHFVPVEPHRAAAFTRHRAAVQLAGNLALALAQNVIDSRGNRRDPVCGFAFRRARSEAFWEFFGDEPRR